MIIKVKDENGKEYQVEKSALVPIVVPYDVIISSGTCKLSVNIDKEKSRVSFNEFSGGTSLQFDKRKAETIFHFGKIFLEAAAYAGYTGPFEVKNWCVNDKHVEKKFWTIKNGTN